MLQSALVTNFKGKNMILFDLEKALAGDKVVTRDGKKCTQLKLYEGIKNNHCLVGVVNHVIKSFTLNGTNHEDYKSLFMAPKNLSGFANVYSDGHSIIFHHTKEEADKSDKYNNRVACINLSQFEEGHGL